MCKRKPQPSSFRWKNNFVQLSLGPQRKENQFHCFSASEVSPCTQWFIWRVQSFKSKTNQSLKHEGTLLFGQVYPVEKQTPLSVVRPPSVLEFSTFTNQPSKEGTVQLSSTAWGRCENLLASLGWVGHDDRELSHTDGRGRPTPPSKLCIGPFPARASKLFM